jgi:hypothetical protein
VTRCNQAKYGRAQAERAVRRRRDGFAYRCSDCGALHVGSGNKTGRLIEMSNSEGRLMMHLRGEIVKGGDSAA